MFNKLKGDPLMGLLIVIFGLVFFIPSLKLGVIAPGDIGGPGAGFFPAICSSFVMFFGAWVIFDGLKGKNTKYFEDDPELVKNIKLLFLLAAIFVSCLIIWVYVNFFLAMALLSLSFNFIFGRKALFNILFTIVIVALLYFVFEQLLYIQFEI